MLDTITTCCKQLGLTISCKKTKSLAVLPPKGPDVQYPAPIQLVPEEEPIEVFSHFQYLCSIVQRDCGMDSEINSRICKTSVAFQSLSRILWLQRKSRSGPKYVSSTVSFCPPCCMVWRAQSSWSLTFAVLSPFRSTARGLTWGYPSGRRSVTPLFVRLPGSRGFHPSSLSTVFTFSGTAQGCLITA